MDVLLMSDEEKLDHTNTMKYLKKKLFVENWDEFSEICYHFWNLLSFLKSVTELTYFRFAGSSIAADWRLDMSFFYQLSYHMLQSSVIFIFYSVSFPLYQVWTEN